MKTWLKGLPIDLLQLWGVRVSFDADGVSACIRVGHNVDGVVRALRTLADRIESLDTAKEGSPE